MAIKNKVVKQHFGVAVLVFVPIKDDLFLLISKKISLQNRVKVKNEVVKNCCNCYMTVFSTFAA